MKILLVGGYFSAAGGKSSLLIDRLAAYMNVSVTNGGTIEELEYIHREVVKDLDCLVWMPNIDNDHDKFLPDIKKHNPKLLLVSSKRQEGRDFTPQDMIGRMLKNHSNLGILIHPFSGIGGKYSFQILDPLGNTYGHPVRTGEFGYKLMDRITFLLGQKRVGSRRIAHKGAVTFNEGFLEMVRLLGDRFGNFAEQVNPNRLMGNAATRCSAGFPAYKIGSQIFVSRRNVDKVTLCDKDFVPVRFLDDGVIGYWGDDKPSVDTGIQLELLKRFPNLNYVVHGHCYVEGAPMTEHKVPCGDLREIDEITKITIGPFIDTLVVNLKGHGCIIAGKDYEWFDKVVLKARPFPEGV